MSKVLPQFYWKYTPWLALLGAIVLTLLLFAIIPLTQYLQSNQEKVLEIREVVSIDPPPPVAPPPPEEPPPPTEQAPTPKLEQVVQDIPINQLELSLDAGFGDAIAMGVPSASFSIKSDLVDDIKKLFTFDDIDERPRIISSVATQFPRSLIRRRIYEGKVVMLIEIDTKGTPRLLRIISSTQPELEAVARQTIKRTKFTVSKRNGVPVVVQGEQAMIFKAPR